jgi:hypothetical protein
MAPAQSIEGAALPSDLREVRTEGGDAGVAVHGAFDAVVLAIPHLQEQALLRTMPHSGALGKALNKVTVLPCWTLMLAFPQAVQPGLTTLGPSWNAARSTHHRIAWLARESSKPGRSTVERWTVQASADWSAEHIQDSPERVQAKLLRAFAEITGIQIHSGAARFDDAQGTPFSQVGHVGRCARMRGTAMIFRRETQTRRVSSNKTFARRTVAAMSAAVSNAETITTRSAPARMTSVRLSMLMPPMQNTGIIFPTN